jgi:hypothetical protein
MPHAPGNVRECEGIDPHTPKGTLTLGVGIPVDFQIFRAGFQGSKLITFKSSLYHWKSFDKGYNFGLDLISIRGLQTKL